MSDVEEAEQLEGIEAIQVKIFEPACATAGCHNGTTRAAGVDLSTADASYATLVGQPAENTVANENGWVRVKPGDPELSFLVRKLHQPGIGEGAAMPIGDYQLTEPYMEMIDEWIKSGAAR